MFEPPGLLDGLNEDQCKAATHQGGPLLVLAGAGTGKTRTLVARAAWLRAQGVPASRILLLTFTRRAADDMLARVTPAGAGAADRVCGGTFHAVAHQIIRAHAESFSLPPQFSVIDPPDVTDLLDAARAEHGLVGTQRRAPRAATCADIYTRCVNTHATVQQVITASFPWCTDYEAQLGRLFRGYVAHKRQHGLVDFDDLLLLWRAALADPAAGPVLRGMFDAVLVDEYQDVNAVQADIVRLLRPDGPGLTCVGDDAQAIYAFRGADPAHLRQLGEHYPGLEVVRLARNYRSKDAVLTLANTVRPQSPGLELALTSDRGRGSRPQLVRCHDEATQAREICARVLAAHEAGADLRGQAVLMRAAGHSDVLEVELSVRGIPFIKYGGLRFTEAAHVKDFLAAARVVANPADDVAWFRVLRLHEGVGPVHAGRAVAALRLAEPGPLARWADAAAAVPARAGAAVSATLSALAGAAALDRTADRATAILAALDAPLRGRYPDVGVRLSDLQRLADAAATRPSLHDALVELALDPPVSVSDLAGPPRLDEDYLVLSTIHSAKGLEWPVVHLMHLVDGAVPSDMALGSPEGLAEERRLFYVAVTRARDELYLYAPLRMHLHRMSADDRHGYGQLTRFLTPAAQAVCEPVQAIPPEPVVPRIGPLAATVDAALDSLFGPA
ncbi:MAG TPA: ATP-dependent helicase [Streptosporangiaceae bacterium]|nr:ATP-dependent helicase [Streptosporangiaceae bacterium]